MLGQVEVAAVGQPLELGPPHREEVLDVGGRARVVRQLLRTVLAELEMVGPDPELRVPGHPLLHPALVPARGLGGRHEELDLHLLELPRAEDEVPGGDLVAERLANLSDSEGRPLAGELKDVLEVDEDALRRLGPQVDPRALVLHGPHVGLEHEVELAWLGELAAAFRAAQLGVRIGALGRGLLAQMVLAPAALARAEALDERVGEALEVTGGLPRLRVHEDRGVERDHVVALLHDRPPPLGLDVRLEEDAVVPVVVGRRQPAVDLRGLEDEATPLAEGDDLLHRRGVAPRRGHRRETLEGGRAVTGSDAAAQAKCGESGMTVLSMVPNTRPTARN